MEYNINLFNNWKKLETEYMIVLVNNNSLTRKSNMLTTMVFNSCYFNPSSSLPINTKSSPFLSQQLSRIHSHNNPTIFKYLNHKNHLQISGTHFSQS